MKNSCKKIVTVSDFIGLKKKTITKEHEALLSAGVSALVTYYFISDLKNGNGFVRSFKSNTNKYLNFLQNEVIKVFQDSYDLNDENIENMYKWIEDRARITQQDFSLQLTLQVEKEKK